MARHVSSLKRERQAQKRRDRNRSALSALRTYVKKAYEALAGDDPVLAQSRYCTAVSYIDRIAAKGIIPRNRASRRVHKLTLCLNLFRVSRPSTAVS